MPTVSALFEPHSWIEPHPLRNRNHAKRQFLWVFYVTIWGQKPILKNRTPGLHSSGYGSKTHLAGAGALPLRIATDIRGVKFKTLPYYELEKGLNRFFHRWPWKILQIQKLAYLPNSDTSIIGHYFHFMVTNSTFHDYIRLLKVVDIMYDKISIDFDGQKWPN